MIGRALADYLMCTGKSVLETTHRSETISETRIFLDFNEDVSSWVSPCHISEAFICAAVSSLERCKREPTLSAMVNVHNTVALAKKLVAKGTFVVFLSTNLVYDGSIPFRKAEDAVCPQTEYGRQKAEAEKELLALGDLISIVRFTKVFFHESPLFKGWIRALQNNNIINPFLDMVMAPVPLAFAVDVLFRVAEKRLPGIVQVSGDKDVTYEQAANYIAQCISAGKDLVQPVRSKDACVQLEANPLHTTLDMTRLRKELGISPPDIKKTIDSVLFL
jgi:dTDP-4-dehydrorhamnose reductase